MSELADRLEAELRGEIFGTQETPLTEAEWRAIIAALRAQLPEARSSDAKDAARYRWLRSEHDIGQGQPYIGVHDGHFSRWTGTNADLLVDAAMPVTPTDYPPLP